MSIGLPTSVKNETIGSDEQPGVLTTISGGIPQMMLGVYPGGLVASDVAFTGIKLAQPGVDVRTATDSEIIFSTERSYVQYIFSTFTASPNEAVTDPVGFVNYSDTVAGGQNRVVRLDFYKPSNLTITSVDLRQRLFQGLDIVSGNSVNMLDLTTYLNPTKTKTTGATSGQDFYRFSGGQTIRSLHDQSADEEEINDIFDSTELAAISTGWNEVVVQMQTSSTSSFGFIVLNLVIQGYITF